LHLQAKRLRVLADDGRRKEPRHVENVFVAKRLVQFAAVGRQSTDATLLVLIVETFRNENAGYVPRFFAAAIIGENPRAFELQMVPLSSLAVSGEQ
jgi:hypothetical protein